MTEYYKIIHIEAPDSSYWSLYKIARDQKGDESCRVFIDEWEPSIHHTKTELFTFVQKNKLVLEIHKVLEDELDIMLMLMELGK
jgi:hypothetical protein